MGWDEALKNLNNPQAMGRIGGILGVTVMTSFETDDCVSIYGDTPEKKVIQFAKTAEAAYRIEQEIKEAL